MYMWVYVKVTGWELYFFQCYYNHLWDHLLLFTLPCDTREILSIGDWQLKSIGEVLRTSRVLIFTCILTIHGQGTWCSDWTWTHEMMSWVDIEGWDGVLTGHGPMGGVLTGHGQEIWCTDWTWAEEMVYWLDRGRRYGVLSGHSRRCTKCIDYKLTRAGDMV